MKRISVITLCLFIIIAFIATTAPDALAKNPNKDHHKTQLHGKVHGNADGTKIEIPNVWTYWWNNNGSATIEVSLEGLEEDYTADVFINGSYFGTLYPPTADIADSNFVLVNEVRTRISVFEPGQYNVEIRVNVTKNKKLFLEFSNQLYIPPIEAYFAGVILNGDSVDLKYNLYPLFEDVVAGDQIEVSIDGVVIGTGQVVIGSWGQLEVSIPVVSFEYYQMYITGFRDTTLTVVGSGISIDIKAYYWPI